MRFTEKFELLELQLDCFLLFRDVEIGISSVDKLLSTFNLWIKLSELHSSNVRAGSKDAFKLYLSRQKVECNITYGDFLHNCGASLGLSP